MHKHLSTFQIMLWNYSQMLFWGLKGMTTFKAYLSPCFLPMGLYPSSVLQAMCKETPLNGTADLHINAQTLCQFK